MEWVLVPITLGSMILTYLLYNSLRTERNGFLATNVRDAYTKGNLAGLLLGVAITMTSGMIVDTIVRLVK